MKINRKRNKHIRILFQILRNTLIWKAIMSYLVFFFIIALIIQIVEPTINTYGDAVWYVFVSSTTIGFGDFTATTLIGRICTIIIYWYTILIVAVITAMFTQYFIELAKARRNSSVAEFQDDLEHLSELSKERLEEISKRIRKFKDKS